MFDFSPAARPTMYFIGVTTGSSSIMKVFPEWARALKLKDTVMRGIDLPIHAPAEDYRRVVRFLKEDPLSMGALVTTHKLDLYNAAQDLFEFRDHYAQSFGELSSISKRGPELRAHAKDPISCGLALEEFVPAEYWQAHPQAGVLILGAGGSAISMCSYFMRPEFAGNYPARIAIANRSQPRLTEIESINKKLNPGGVLCEYHLTPEPGQNDAVLASMPEGSLVINATGLGKDRPGSPLTDKAAFPQKALVWEINYRGDLLFKRQAEAQAADKGLHVEDGWKYFIYGWTQVISEVFNMPIEGETLNELDRIAATFNK